MPTCSQQSSMPTGCVSSVEGSTTKPFSYKVETNPHGSIIDFP